MGTFRTRVGVGNPTNGEFQWVEALVDTGAAHSMMPASLLDQALHLSPTREQTFVLADGSRQSYGRGQALFKIEDAEEICPVVFGPEDRYLLGATTLQNFDLIADTTHHCLVPAPELTL